ncbi:MAG: hypothetical protein ACRDJE_03560 [Dehalococcoidia bacterium]
MAESVKISTADFNAVAGKLEDLGQQLPPNQKIVLHWLLERAQAAGPAEPEEDVGGFGLPTGPGTGAAGVHTASQVWGLSGLSRSSNLKIEISGGPIVVDVQ